MSHASLPEIWGYCTVAWSVVLGPAALYKAPNTITGVAQYLAAAAGVAAMFGAWFAIPIWLAVRYGV